VIVTVAAQQAGTIIMSNKSVPINS